MSRANVAVVGAGVASDDVLQSAEAVGRELASADCVVLCGGLGGVMEAVCRGARSAGGTTIGILPGSSSAGANAFLDVVLPTGLGEARNTVIVHAADVVIAVGGEFGTLSEIALALKIGRPVIGLGTWDLAREGEVVEVFQRAASPAEAVGLALTALDGR